MMELNMDEMVEFIQDQLIKKHGAIVTRNDIFSILDLEMEYMELNGFVEHPEDEEV